MENPTITASSAYHFDAAIAILEDNGVEPSVDTFADQIIERFHRDDNVKMLLTRNMRISDVDEEAVVAMRKGWAFLKAIFGEAVAVPLVCHAGIMAVVGAQRTLFGIGGEPEYVRDKISIPATIVANICDAVAEYNCVEGERVITHLLNDIPLTTTDRDLVVSTVKFIDYTISKPN